MDAPPVQYVKTSDGYDIAWCATGAGRTFLTAPLPHSHLQLNWVQPGEQLLFLRGLAQRFHLVQYDARGQGLSTRNLPEGTTCDDLLLDMEAVAAGLGDKPMLLYGWGNAMGQLALLFAAKHPERVDGLILQCSAVHAGRWPVSLFVDLPAQNWDYYLHQVARARVESNQLAGRDGGRETEIFNNLVQSVNQQDWQRTLQAFLRLDVSETLGNLHVPTLVLHQRDFRPLPAEEAVKLAAGIPNARLVLLEGSSLLGNTEHLLGAIDDFVAGLAPGDAPAAAENLSLREVEVLRLIAAGKSNQQIADDLVISLNTVRRHVSNIFDKTGAQNRAQAAIYARDHGLA